MAPRRRPIPSIAVRTGGVGAEQGRAVIERHAGDRAVAIRRGGVDGEVRAHGRVVSRAGDGDRRRLVDQRRPGVACHPDRPVDQGAIDATRSGVTGRGAAVLIQAPAPDQPRRRDDLAVHAVGDLRRRARVVPDAHFVHEPFEISRGRSGGVHRRAQGKVLDAVEAGHLDISAARDLETGIGHAVDIQAPPTAVIGHSTMMPDAGGQNDGSDHRMIESVVHVLKVRRQPVVRLHPKDVVAIDIAAVGLAATLVDQRIDVDPARAAAGSDTRAVDPDPTFQREVTRAQARCHTHGHMVVRAVEGQA